jgi:hypothetical protein
MRTTLSAAVAAAVVLTALLGAESAMAQDVTVVGPVTRIEFASDQKSAVATLKDGKTGDEVKVQVSDELTLDKFKDKRIVEGDEIRARFGKQDGANQSKSFRKTAGC